MTSGNKKLYMWISVISITVIIGSIWIALLKYDISTSITSISSTKDKGFESLSNVQKELEEQLREIKELFKEPIATSTPETTTTTIRAATSTF